MQKNTSLQRIIVENLLWFLGALALAFLVWVIATLQLDPVEEWRLRESIPIRVTPDAGLMVTNSDTITRNAFVWVRGPRSVRELLAADEIIVWADLAGLGPDSHVVELNWEIASDRRARISDISPRQITVNLEEVASRYVEVRPEYVGRLPFGYSIVGQPTFDVNQVAVTGPASRVEQVAAVQARIELADQRTPFFDEVRPIPVDVDGNQVPNITVDTPIIRYNVEVGPTTSDS